MPSLTRQRSASASSLAPTAPRSAAVDDEPACAQASSRPFRDGARRACESKSRNAKADFDADVDAMDWAPDATDVLRAQRRVAA
jgi:hypothetical protein